MNVRFAPKYIKIKYFSFFDLIRFLFRSDVAKVAGEVDKISGYGKLIKVIQMLRKLKECTESN